jgi:hypothetical protein
VTGSKVVPPQAHSGSLISSVLSGTVWMYSIAMEPQEQELRDVQWVAACAHRLRDRWPHADPTIVEELAADLWMNPALRPLPPTDAAEAWLQPIGATRVRATASDGPP